MKDVEELELPHMAKILEGKHDAFEFKYLAYQKHMQD